MKLFKISAMMLAGLALGACSSSDDAISDGANGSGNNQTGVKSWVGFNIMLPSVPASTKANIDTDLNDGDISEYQVKKATLFLFKSDADNAKAAEASNGTTFIGAYDMTIDPFAMNSAAGCTTEGVLTAEILNGDKTGANPGLDKTDENIYAYVVLNGTSIGITLSNNTDVSVLGVTGNISQTTTWAAFKDMLVAADQITSGYTEHAATDDAVVADYGLLMTSAPVSASQGGSMASEGPVTVLTKLDASKLFNTKELASSNPAAEIYVERAAVKVLTTLSNPTGAGASTQVEQTEELSKKVFFDLENNTTWCIGNINQRFYPSRQWMDVWNGLGTNATVGANLKYRFVANDKIHDGIWRTFWAKDPNYVTINGTWTESATNPVAGYQDALGTNFTKITPEDGDYKYASGTNHYTIENTMDELGMQHRYTTYVGIKTSLKVGEDDATATAQTFYTLPKATGANTVYTNAEEVYQYIKNVFLAMTKSGTYTTDQLTGITFGLNDSGTKDNVQITVTAGTVDDADLTKLKELVGPVYEYQNGVVYYLVPIRHFGETENTETPWNEATKVSQQYRHVYPATGETNAANSRAADYLGRYGVIRNNWYQLEIDGIRRIGSPVPITPDDTPDDEVDKYLSVKIHVTPWVIRKSTGIKL